MATPTQMLLAFDDRLDKIEAFLLSWSVILLTTITIGNVISRRFFGYSWSFTEEISQLFLIIMTFAGVGYAARQASHICMTAFYEFLPLKFKKVVTIFISFTTAFVLYYLTWYACKYVYTAYTLNKMTPALQIPFYLFIIIVPIGLFLGGTQYTITGIKNLFTDGVWISVRVSLDSQKDLV